MRVCCFSSPRQCVATGRQPPANRGLKKKKPQNEKLLPQLKEKVLTKEQAEAGDKGFMQEKQSGKSRDAKYLVYFTMTKRLQL